MSLYSYFKKQVKEVKESPECETRVGLPRFSPLGSTLSQKEVEKANKGVEAVLDGRDADGDRAKRGKYYVYTAARIGKYGAENGTTRACRHFSQLWKRNIPEPTLRMSIFRSLNSRKAIQWIHYQENNKEDLF